MSIKYIVIMTPVFLSLFALTGCNDGYEIEISLKTTTTSSQTTQVYIGGAVNNPGYYMLIEGDTIYSLILAAGGIPDDSGISRLELTINQPDTQEQVQKVDINRAPAWLLEALPGIGETRAQTIIRYRMENGFFKNINELLNVKGIGQGIFDNIKDLITASD
ncbi:MAG: helix-hairpin-helix domain-containing protein [Dehalococcoidales bacterium]|nr:helix-hairpin-helix domain-containing protein [Dehalococcoidales bacterium]